MNLSAFHSRYPEFVGPPPEKLLRAMVLEVLQDLCDRTWVYSEIFTELTTAGTYEYTLAPSVSTDEILGVFENEVEVATVDTPQPTAAAATAGAGTLTNGNTYVYKVTATKDDYGETLPCAAVSAVATAIGIISLSWDAIEGADDYNVYRNDGAGGTTYGLLEAAGTNSYNDDGDVAPTTATTPPTTSVLMKEIGLTNPSNLKVPGSNWRHREGDTINRIIYDGNETIRIDPIPDTSGIGMQMKIALKPMSSDKDVALPAVFERYLDLIDEGVRWKLHLLPKTKDFPWVDTQLGAYHRGNYLVKRSGVKTARMFGFGGRSTMQPRRGSPWY